MKVLIIIAAILGFIPLLTSFFFPDYSKIGFLLGAFGMLMFSIVWAKKLFDHRRKL